MEISFILFAKHAPIKFWCHCFSVGVAWLALTHKYSSFSGDIFQAWQLCLSPLKHSSHFYIESNQSPWMLATDCVFWCSILWKTFIVSLTVQYLVFFTTRYQQYEKILNSKTSVNGLKKENKPTLPVWLFDGIKVCV